MENIEHWPIDKFIEYARNPRKNDHAVDRIASAINEFGFKVPIIAKSDGSVVDGHLRLKAAKKLKLDTLPVLLADDLTDAQIKAFRLSINKMAEIAEWDDELLALELEELKELDFDLDLIGFDDDELLDILNPADVEGLTDDDAVPEIQDDAISKRGDIWLLGDHRVMCGDSTSIDAVETLMDGQKADMVFTSPPYAQQRDYGAAKEAVQEWDKLMNGVFASTPIKEGGSILVNLGMVHSNGKVNHYWDEWLDYMASNEWPLFGWYVWDQGHGMPGNWNGRLAPSHEFIFHFANKPSQSNKWVHKKAESITTGGKGRTFRQKDGSMKKIYSPQTSAQPTKVADSVIRVNRNPSESAKTGHPAVFPTALCEYIYNSFAKRGDIVYEPFCGAGTSIVASEKYGISCYSMELDPKYCDVIVRRWQEYTGKEATLESTGETFDSQEAA